jgi:hypothetical protein
MYKNIIIKQISLQKDHNSLMILLEKPVTPATSGRNKLTTQNLELNPCCFVMYVSGIRPSFEVVKEVWILYNPIDFSWFNLVAGTFSGDGQER